MSKTLLVLGAGAHQVPLVRRAVAGGHHVVTADYVPGNVGHRYSHASVDVSTSDVEAVLACARDLRIDGVATIASDVALPALAVVAAALELPGPSPDAVAVLCDKARFRSLQHAHGLAAPGYALATSPEEANVAAAALAGGPLLCKPADTSGSRGITLLESPEPRSVTQAFEAAVLHSRNGRVCVEEYVEGEDVSGDGFLLAGVLSGAVVTSKHTSGFVVDGHALPTHLDGSQRALVLGAVEAAAAAAGYREGPLDFDVRLSPDRAVVIEMSPRLGGNGIPALASHGTNSDLLGAMVGQSLGEPVSLPTSPVVHTPCGSVALGSGSSGRLGSIATADAIRRSVPEVFDVTLVRGVGEHVDAHTHGGAALGQALFDIPRGDGWQDLADRVRQASAVRVEALSAP